MRRTSFFFALALVIPSVLASGCATESTPPGDDAGRDASPLDAPAIDGGSCTTAASCDDGLYCNGTETCTGGTCHAGTAPTCDDGVACTVDRCVESRRVCESAPPDYDADGFADIACHDSGGVALGTDCDDTDAMRHPGLTEVCDTTGHDEDCNPATYGAIDADGDAFDDAACCNTGGLCGTDCDDTDPAISPSDAEICNGVNDDCDMHVDEGLPIVPYTPDCDLDGYGDATATPMMACTTPAAAPCLTSGGQWVMQAGDCADADPNRHTGATEACNAIDDDCDGFVDDIIDHNPICRAGQTTTCNTTCGQAGLQTCSGTCLAYDAACVATEICNGCDDDADGSVDDGFTCARGTSENCTVPTCGSPGTRVCGTSCGWGACTGTETCNYCDDNGSGNYFEERSQASLTSTDHFQDCTTNVFGGHTSCQPENMTSSQQELWLTLLDGTSNDQAGAIWLTPSTWIQGWGPIDITVEMEVHAVSINPANAEMPLGGWSIVAARTGTAGVGTPRARGIPTGIQGVTANWYWSTYETCMFPNNPPSSGDSVRYNGARQVGGSSGDTCTSGISISGTATSFDGVSSGTIVERMNIRYTPDDPTTSAVNEEAAVLTAGTPSGIALNFTTANDLPLGSGPLRIGITAGTYTQSGFSGGPPPSLVFGVPVVARVRMWTQHYGPPNHFDGYGTTIVRSQICP